MKANYHYIFIYTFFFLIISCNSDETPIEQDEGPQYSLPILQTSNTSSITENSAISGGTITDDGGDIIIERGVCWNTSQNPTINDNRTTDGSGVGIFTSNIDGLVENTIYYVRAYATNSVGTAYGNPEIFTTLESETVFIGDVSLKTQAEVNEFGSNNYQIITGRLYIGLDDGDSNILDLIPLSSIVSVSELIIANCSSLLDLNGLNNITSEIENLTIVNNGLYSLEGLNISKINNHLNIFNNDLLNNLDALQNITSDLERLSIHNNDNLINISPLNINSISTNLSIEYNEKLENLEFLSNLTNPPSIITIRNNFALSDISGLSNSAINFNTNNSFRLWSNQNLTNLNGLENISLLRSLSISNNENLINIDALSNLNYIENVLYLTENNMLLSIDALSNLTTVNDEIRIKDNLYLSDLCGITNLIVNGTYGNYNIEGNNYNPTEKDIVNGDCSL